MPVFCPSSLEWGSVADWVGGLLTGLGIIAAVRLAGRPERDRQRQDRIAREASAQFLALKIRGMLSGVELIGQHFGQPKPQAWPDDARIERWRWIKHPIGIAGDGAMTITPAEILPFLDGGEAAYAGDLALYSRRYASLFEIVQEYRDMRRELEALPLQEAKHEGTLLRGSVAWAPSAKAEALSASLEDEVELITERAKALKDEGSELAKRFVPSTRLALNAPKFVVLE